MLRAGWLLLQAPTTPPESDPLSTLLNQLEQLMPPRAWTVLFLGFVVLVFLVNLGGQAAGILSWLGVPSPFKRSQPSRDELKDIRCQLLNIVKKEFNRRLATSLHNLVKLDLYMEDQRQRVGTPKYELVPEDGESGFQSVNRILRTKGNKSPLELKFTQKIIEVFEREDIQGKLLILGEPGSGKTTELLQLAQDLVTRVERDPGQPVPVILELSSWNGEPIDKWVISQIDNLYSLSRDTTQQWLANNQILLLLDGLDELGLIKQTQCIEKINQFLETTRTSELVVCCRHEEYETSQIELDSLNGAVYLEALKEDQIRDYFEKLNRLSLWSNVYSNPTLLELAQKPLFLFMLVVTYQGKPIHNEQELFDAYIEKQLHDPNNQGTYKSGKDPGPKQTRHYLVWLAKQLENIRETEFLIERLQPTWLPSTKQISLYRLIFGLGIRLIFGLGYGLIFGLIFGLGYGLIFGLIFGMIGGLNIKRKVLVITPEEKLQFSSHYRLGVKLIFGLIFGLFSGLLGGLTFGLLAGLVLGLCGGMIGGMIGDKPIRVPITDKKTPNQGIRKSIQKALYVERDVVLSFVLLGFVLDVDSIFGLDIGFWLIFGLIFGLFGGLNICLDTAIKHFILRIFLTKNGYTPWNYARFLDHAVKHRFIQRTGGRYRFVHDLLRNHFAAMPLK